VNSIVLHSELSYIFYGFLVIAFGGYFVLTGSSFLYFYLLKRSEWLSKKIQEEIPSRSDILREIGWSLSSTVIWVFFAIGIILGVDGGIFKLYFEISDYGIIYFVLSIFLLILAHDTYFYWTHRFMHSSFKVYKIFHRTHHLSKNPTPFAIHAFGPLEACVYATFIPLILLLMPVHLYALMTWFLIEAVVNVLGHLGHELFPLKIFTRGPGKWINSPTHHNLHHQESRYGFGHYFNFWDRVMGTNHPNYEQVIRKDQMKKSSIPHSPITLYSNVIWQSILSQANLYPDKKVLIQTDGKSATFTEFVLLVNGFAASLKHLGVQKGDRVIFLERPTIRGVAIFFALYRMGATVVIADPAMGNENFLSRVKYSCAKWTVIDPKLNFLRKIPIATKLLRVLNYEIPDLHNTLPQPIALSKVSNFATETIEEVKIEDESEALIIFTSGTTSSPKGVVHDFGSIRSMLDLICSNVTVTPDDIFYSSQLHFTLIALLTGSSAVMEVKNEFEPKRFYSSIKTFNPSHIFLLPKEGEELIAYTENRAGTILLESVKTIMFGSAPVLIGFLSNFQKIVSYQTKFFCLYGSTEILPITIATLEEKLAYGGVGDYLGRPLKGIDVDIRDQEIVVKGKNLCQRYLHENESLQTFYTGDLGFITSNGSLILTGRKKDMIIKGNHNIYPTLFESTISKIPGVHACAMIGIYDDTKQDERIVLFIEKNSIESDSIFIKNIQNALKSSEFSIDTYAFPDYIFCRVLPVSGRSRKVDKVKLREIAQQLI